MPKIILHPNEQSLLATLVYSDTFDYPLRIEELKKYFIKIKAESFWDEKNLNSLLKKKIISKENNFYFLKNKEGVVKKRENIFKINSEKLEIAKKYALILSKIPTIELIGISGSLSVFNAKEADDIDFFIITSSNTLWVTRFLSNVILKILKVKREKKEINPKNKICLNMFIDKKNLSLPQKMRNLYTAHEVIQMSPVFVRNNTYSNFLKANSWLNGHLTYSFFTNEPQKYSIKNSTNFLKKTLIFFIQIFEQPSKFFQILYMKNITNEKILNNLLAFHPNDLTTEILKEYNTRLEKQFLL